MADDSTGDDFLDPKALSALKYLPAKDLDRWRPGSFYDMGDRILASNGRVQIAECAGMSNYGTSGIDEPHFPEMEGCTTLDGTIVWKSEGFPLGIPPGWARDIIAKANTQYNIVDYNSVFDMNGKPVTQSTKAKEAEPKKIEPLWEEREV